MHPRSCWTFGACRFAPQDVGEAALDHHVFRAVVPQGLDWLAPQLPVTPAVGNAVEAGCLPKHVTLAGLGREKFEELDALRAEQYTAMVAQRRQLELSKLHEGQRLMREWQEEGYSKHADNLTRRKESEQKG